MFSVLKKVWRDVIGALHDLIDNNRDAGRAVRQSVREIDAQIRRAEESVTDVSAQRRLMVNDCDKAKTDATQWGLIALAASNSGEREKAIEAVHNQVAAEERAQTYSQHVERVTPQLEQLKSRLADLRLKKREREHKASLLDARSKLADAEARAARYLGNVGEGGGEDIEQLERNVDRKEAKAAALADMAHEKVESTVDQRLANHSRRLAIAEKLGALGLQAVEPAQPIEGEGRTHA